MKTLLSVTLLGVSLLFLTSSCSKSSTSKDHDLYVFGEAQGAPRSLFYMKNRQVIPLEENNPVHYGMMFVDGNDVYFPFKNGYLKNGVMVTLPGATPASRVLVSGGVVYAAGRLEDRSVAYWKDGQAVRLGPDSVAASTFPVSLIVEGNDIYVGGSYYPPGPVDKVVYWKNGVLNVVADGSLYCMTVSGGDIYIGGITAVDNTLVGVYWKNGVRQDIFGLEGQRPSGISSIEVHNGDVYATGFGDGTTLYWKNGNPVGGFGNHGSPHTIKVDNNNIYVLENISYSIPGGMKNAVLLWKNGNADTLFNGHGMGLFVGQTIKTEE